MAIRLKNQHPLKCHQICAKKLRKNEEKSYLNTYSIQWARLLSYLDICMCHDISGQFYQNRNHFRLINHYHYHRRTLLTRNN